MKTSGNDGGKLMRIFDLPLWFRVLFPSLLFLTTMGTYEAAGRSGPATHMFYIPIIVASAFLNLWGGLLVALATGALLGVWLVPSPDLGSERFSVATTRLLFYLLVGGTTAVLLHQIRLSLASLAEERESSTQHMQELEALHEIDRTILATPELDTVTQTVVALVGRLMGAKLCTLRLADADFRYLLPAATYTASPEDAEAWQRIFGGRPLRVGEGVSGWTLLTGEPTAIADVLEDPRTAPNRSLYQEMGIRALLSAPVIVGGKILGALTVAHPEVRQHSQEEVSRLTRLGSQMAIAIQSAQQQLRIKTFTRETIIVLAEAIEHRDPYTGGHCERLGTLASALAKRLGLPAADREQMEYAALLHDVGKIAVPDSVLLKPGPLTPEEWVLMRNHSFVGSQIAKKVDFLEPMAPLIYHHHERFDGTGYLDGLAGERIPLGSRIIAVADAYDAMTNDRPYRKALSREAALEEVERGAGTQFDPAVIAAFRDVVKQA